MLFLQRSKMSFSTAMMVHKAVPSAKQCCSFTTAMIVHDAVPSAQQCCSFSTAMMVHDAVPSAQQCCSLSTAMMFFQIRNFISSAEQYCSFKAAMMFLKHNTAVPVALFYNVPSFAYKTFCYVRTVMRRKWCCFLPKSFFTVF
jgi:hypothetical protein